MLKKIFITSALLGCAASAFSASNRPDGYVTICKIGQTCSVSGSTNVAFGASGQFVYKILNGSFSCSVATFGSDPMPSKSVKECSISSGSGSGGGSSSSTPSNSSGISLNANSGNGSASLSWSNPGNVNAIEVYRDTDSNPDGRVRIASLGSSSNSYSATGLNNGTTYYFWLKYRLADGTWYNSTAASATPSGSGSGGGSSSSTGNSGSITGATCSPGSTVNVSSTIIVSSGTYDGGCKVFNATSALGSGSQSEGQKPVFRVENGATLKNVVLGNNAADGIHFYNGGTIDNIRWTNVGEDAMTIKSSGTVNVKNISGYAGSDKFIQVNAASTLNISNCIVDDMGKFLRQNGGTTFKTAVSVDRCQISNMGEGIFRTDSSTSTAKITNSRLKNAGDICIGKWASCTSSGITNY